MSHRYIVLWRKAEEGKMLEWDFHTCESRDEVDEVVGNLKRRGVHQYATYELGAKLPDCSSAY